MVRHRTQVIVTMLYTAELVLKSQLTSRPSGLRRGWARWDGRGGAPKVTALAYVT
jgi:hypothetical protein